MPPQQSGGGNAKYAVIGLLLIAAAVGVWFAMKNVETPPPPPPPDAGLRPSTALVENDLVIPDPEPDAGPIVDAGAPGTCTTTADCNPGARCVQGHCTRFTTRYVAGDWECGGNLSPAQAQGVIAENRRQVRNCYERRLKVNHTLQGNLSLRLKINAAGAVEATSVGGSLGDPEVFACVRNLASTWRFPTPQGGSCAVVSVPFNFSPQE
jgi:hypothetical protein